MTYSHSCQIWKDGIDYVPAKAPLLLGQHFSAIAAAGPIVGIVLLALALWLIAEAAGMLVFKRGSSVETAS